MISMDRLTLDSIRKRIQALNLKTEPKEVKHPHTGKWETLPPRLNSMDMSCLSSDLQDLRVAFRRDPDNTIIRDLIKQISLLQKKYIELKGGTRRC